jgi:hypothetical protein
MTKTSGNLTILVNTCDAYSDIWPLFFAALNEYWPQRKYNLVLNTELISDIPSGVENVSIKNFKPINGNDSWGLRLREALKSIDTEYVLAIYDDFIIEDFMDEVEIIALLDRMEFDDQISAVYLTKLGSKFKENEHLFGDRKHPDNKYVLLEDKIDYRLNSAPALWRKSELLKYTGAHDNPWAWEVFGSYRTFNNEKKFYCPATFEKDIYVYNYSGGGAIYRGKWVPEVVLDKNEKYSLNTDFEKRGFSSGSAIEKRSIKWKLDFLALGYKMVGLKVLIFIYRAIKGKLL